MQKNTLTVNSVTYAIKARKLLARDRIQSKLVKVDSSSSGCTYGIEFDAENFYAVVKILRENRIEYSFYSGKG